MRRWSKPAMAAGIALLAAMLPGAAAASAHGARAARVHPATCDQASRPDAARCQLVFRTQSARISPAIVGPSGFTPAQLQSAYGLTTAAASKGSTARVYVVVAYNDSTVDTDLAAYRSQFGLPACTKASGCLKVLNQSGAATPLPITSPSGDDWAPETGLQVDMVSAICPNCGITVLEADDDQGSGLDIALKEAATLGGKFVSVPWAGGDTSSDATMDSQYLQPAGVVYAVASGDNGAAGGAAWPALSPDVVSVGGTTLTSASSARGWNETVWNSTSSGCSTNEPQPSWQSGIVSSGVCSGRAENDVAAVADPNTGVAVYAEGGWQAIGGTSVATPIVAATFALAGTPAPDEHPAALLYEHTADLNDVTSGTNGSCGGSILCAAAVGWDGPTGNGSPNGLTAFAPPPTDPSALTVGSSTKVRYGEKATLHATLTDASTHAAISGPVQLLKRVAGAATFTAAGAAQTSSAGVASLQVAPTSNTTYEWSYPGGGGHASATSPNETVDVTFAVTLTAKPVRVARGKSFELFGTLAPGKAGESVTLDRKRGGSWIKVGTARLAKQKLPNGKRTLGYVFLARSSKKGALTFHVVAGPTVANAAGTSNQVTVTIT